MVGLGEACRVAAREMDCDHQHVARLSKRLLDGIASRLDNIVLNGDATHRYPGNLNISFAFVEVRLLPINRLFSCFFLSALLCVVCAYVFVCVSAVCCVCVCICLCVMCLRTCLRVRVY